MSTPADRKLRVKRHAMSREQVEAAVRAAENPEEEEEEAAGGEVVEGEVIADNLLTPAKKWAVQLLLEPEEGEEPAVLARWQNAIRYESLFAGEDADRLSGRYWRDEKWERMKALESVTFNEEEYCVEDWVVIRPSRAHWDGTIKSPRDDEKEQAVHPKNTWIGSILQLRADKLGRRWAMVAWMYWPSDLVRAHGEDEEGKNGRKAYHGEHELVASNHLDIVDVRTFDRVFTEDIQRCEETEGEVIKEYYWRQTYDVRDKSLSELPRYCKCKKFWKPDTVLIQCPSPTCGKWLHEACVIDSVLSKKWSEICSAEKKRVGKPKKAPLNDRNSPHIDDKRYRERLEGEVDEEGKKVLVKDLRKPAGMQMDEWEGVVIKCLCCRTSFA